MVNSKYLDFEHVDFESAPDLSQYNEDVSNYMFEWSRLMTKMWREKMARLRIVNTGGLADHIQQFDGFSNGKYVVKFEFRKYGYYVDAGVGRGFTAGNTGNLAIMDMTYRRLHNLDIPRKKGPRWGGGYTSGEPRKPREWFNAKWYYSIMNLKDDMVNIMGDAFKAMMISIKLDNE